MIFAAATSPFKGTGDAFLRHVVMSDITLHNVHLLAKGPLRVTTVLVSAAIVSFVVPNFARRLVKAVQRRRKAQHPTGRSDRRTATIGQVIAGTFRATVWVVALVTVLAFGGVHLAPFVATATVIGATVGFGAQTLVKDFLSGLLILVEDQYDVGDSVSIGDITGVIERMNLRTTQIRVLDGTMWHVANGEIRKVGNSSDGFARFVVEVVVPVGTDLNRVLELAGEEALAFSSDPEWESQLEGAPLLGGVRKMSVFDVTIWLLMKMPEYDYGMAAAALRVRVVERIRQEGVAWANGPPFAMLQESLPEDD